MSTADRCEKLTHKLHTQQFFYNKVSCGKKYAELDRPPVLMHQKESDKDDSTAVRVLAKKSYLSSILPVGSGV
jgi:hypothetical protein